MKDVFVKIFSNCSNSYCVIITIDNIFNDEEQVDIWIDDNLKNVAFWKWAQQSKREKDERS